MVSKRKFRQKALLFVKERLKQKKLNGQGQDALDSSSFGDLSTQQGWVLEALDDIGSTDLLSAGFLRDCIESGSLTTHSQFVKSAYSKKTEFAEKHSETKGVGQEGAWVDQRRFHGWGLVSDQKDSVQKIGIAFSRIEDSIEKVANRLSKIESKIDSPPLTDSGAEIKELEIEKFLYRVVEVFREEIVRPMDEKLISLTKAMESTSYFKGLAVQEVDRVRQTESKLKQQVKEERDRANELESEVFALRNQLADMRSLLSLRVKEAESDKDSVNE